MNNYVLNLRYLIGFIFMFIIAAATLGCNGDSTAQQPEASFKFKADQSGDQEVPEVITNTSGKLNIEFNNDLSVAEFTLEVFNGIAINQAHLHCAPAGVNGPIAVFLFPLGGSGPIEPGIDVNGILSEGVLTNADILPIVDDPNCGVIINNIASLAFAAKNGLIYVNTHSDANPGGEVRGQLLE